MEETLRNLQLMEEHLTGRLSTELTGLCINWSVPYLTSQLGPVNRPKQVRIGY